MRQLPVDIPLVETTDPLAGQPDRMADIMASAERHYGAAAIRLGDRLSRRWLVRAGSPYLGEIDAVAAALGRPGAHLLNLSYEWACTTSAGPDPDAPGPRLLRTLDWMFDGLGRDVVVRRRTGAAGPWLDVTWPGFVGVETAMAPGRFAAAINQPPMRRRTPFLPVDWLADRWDWWRATGGLPPAHLLRRVFDTCKDFDAARESLMREPLCLPALFTLAGARPGEGCVIERTGRACAVRPGPACVTNDWVALDAGPARSRGWDSCGRYAMMEGAFRDLPNDFSWVVPPILNAATRLSVIANPGRGSLRVLGWEEGAPATRELVIDGA